MGASGSKSVAATSYDTLRFSWWENSQNVEGNYTVVGWKLELIAANHGYINSSAAKSWAVTVNGNNYSGTNYIGINNNTTKVLASGSTSISHDSEGNKSFNYSFSQEFSINFNGWVGTISGSSSGTLTTIPRKSELSVSNGTLGTAQTLSVTRKSTAYTHTITYECGSYSGTICSKLSETSISWTPELNFANEAPNGESVYISFKIETFNGNTSIGSNSYSIWCTIPSSVKPTVSFAVSDPMGYLSTYGGYVQTKSKFAIVITASGVYGSTIKTYNTTADGKTYTTSSITTEVIKHSGSLTITVIVTDSRGRTATASKTVTVLAYESPKITALTVKRCNSDGTASSSGAYLIATFSSGVTSLNSKNTAVYKIQYKKKTDSSYTTVTISGYADNYTVTNGTHIFAADASFSYDVILSVTDAFSLVSKSAEGPTTSKLFSVLHRGLGWAFGKVAEIEDALEVAWNLYVRKNAYITGDVEATNVEATNVKVTNEIYDKYGMRVRNGLAVHTGSMENAIDPNTTAEHLILTDVNVPISGFAYVHTMFTSDKSGANNRAQIAIPYSKSESMYHRYYYDGSWSAWKPTAYNHTQKVLWSGEVYPNGDYAAVLSEAISSQPNGIMILFKRYDRTNWVQANDGLFWYFIPKYAAVNEPYSHNMSGIHYGGQFAMSKFLYIKDTQIIGNSIDSNGETTSNCGIKINNWWFVMTKVIGV